MDSLKQGPDLDNFEEAALAVNPQPLESSHHLFQMLLESQASHLGFLETQ